jgi:hypothetical protein
MELVDGVESELELEILRATGGLGRRGELSRASVMSLRAMISKGLVESQSYRRVKGNRR